MGNMVSMPGSAQPAAARCVPCLSHHRTLSFIHTILWQGCNPETPPHRPACPFLSSVGRERLSSSPA